MPIIKNTNFDPTDKDSKRFISVPDDTSNKLVLDTTAQKTAFSTPQFLRGPVDFTAEGAISTPEDQAEVKKGFTLLPPTVQDTLQNGEDEDVVKVVDDITTQQEDETRPDVPGVNELSRLAGLAGLSVNEFMKVLGKRTDTGAERAILEEEAGIEDLITKRFTTPSQDTQTKFTELFEASGLSDIQERIKTSNDEISAIKSDFINRKEKHIANPWISQATRNARTARDADLANDRLAIFVSDKQADIDLFNQGLELIEDEVTRFSTDFERDKIMTGEKLNFLLSRIDTQVEDIEAKAEEEKLRFVPDFLKGLITKEEDGESGLSFFGEGGVGLAGAKAVTPIPTFEEFINQKESQAKQTFSQATREGMKADFDKQVASLTEKNERARDARLIATLSSEARSVLKNPSLFHSSFTPTVKGEILSELEKAGIDSTAIARGKKKSVSSTTADDLSQARLAKQAFTEIGQLVEEIAIQGPGIGAVRRANPFDSRIVRLNNLITQAIPGLARGIFKEVGVLTDTDVDRYTRTVANESLTNEQARQATEDLLNKIDSSINLQIETLDALGFEVGNFSDLIGGISATKEEEALSDDDAYKLFLDLI